MAEKYQIYHCAYCGNMVEVLHGGKGELVCCGKPMTLAVAKTADQGMEKHVPVIERIDGGVKVKVGSVAHPMEADHHIEWIEILADGKAYRQFLKPGQAPEAVFHITAETVRVREDCNIHGLWEAK